MQPAPRSPAWAPLCLLPGREAWRRLLCGSPARSMALQHSSGHTCRGLRGPAEPPSEMPAASLNALLGTSTHAHPRSEPRGQWAGEDTDALSCSAPETEGLELLPSLPERSHMTLGTSIPASAKSFYGRQHQAEAPRVLHVHSLHIPWAPAWVVSRLPPNRPL